MRLSRLLAKFDAPFRDIAFEQGENFTIALDIQNSQSRGSATDDLDNGRRRKHGGHPIAVLVEGGRDYRFTQFKAPSNQHEARPFLHYVVGRL